MLRELTTCLALVVGMSVAGGGSAARVPAVHAGETDQSVDLSGTWRLDPERSDMGGPPRGAGPGPGMRSGGGPPGGMGGRGGPPGGGGRGGVGGRDGMRRAPMDGGRGDSLRGRPPGPPQTLRIRQHDGTLRFADSTGAVVREIVTSGDAAGSDGDTLRAGGAAAAVQRVRGRWKNHRLETRRWDWRGTKRTEHYRLEDRGRTLVVETTVEVEGLPSRTMKHVYRRTGG